KTLTLRGSIVEILNNTFEIVEQHPSPFNRLESLILYTNQIPDKVVNYFSEGSSCEVCLKLVDG
ncbi:unnamed protein product, partial [Linum tenue]